MENPLWLPKRTNPNVCRPAATRAGRSAEQDNAAGARANRLVKLSNGRTATASIRLQVFPKGRRVYAYLSFKCEGRNVIEYVGEATAATREEALRKAWTAVAERGIRAKAAKKWLHA